MIREMTTTNSDLRKESIRLITSDFIRAKTDEKEYRIVWLSNGLEVLLITDSGKNNDADGRSFVDEESIGSGSHEDEVANDGEGSVFSEEFEEGEASDDDSHGDKRRGFGGCAVAMAVGVGSFHETNGQEPHGLAHLLEHMLFMGSEKYPTENAYDDHLSRNGGFSNAFTEAECTVYYFEVPQPGLHHALDIFAQFFISPLMLKDSLEREINAVDSEFDTVRADDDLRIKAIWRLGTHSANHPYARFSWGNKQSLLEHSQKDGGRDLRALLQDFYAKYYHVKNMKLVVWSQDSIDTLEQIVKERFEAIPERPLIAKAGASVADSSFSESLPFSSTTCLGYIHRVIPVHECHILRLTWQHAPLKTYKSRPATYVSHLLGHESDGGVLAYLKRKGWATDLWAGTSEDDGHESSSLCSLFSVEIKLTMEGVANYEKVVLAIFAYLGMLRQCGPLRWVFDEVQRISQAAFDFKDEGDPINEVSDLAVNLLPKSKITDRREILVADHLVFDFVEKDIDDLMNSLGYEGDNAPRIDFASSTFGREFHFSKDEQNASDADSQARSSSTPVENIATTINIPGEACREEYWGTRYWKEPWSSALVDQIQLALQRGSSFEPEMGLSLPPHNEYIPDKLHVYDLEPKRVKEDEMRLLHPLIGSKVEIRVQLGKKTQEWLPARIKYGRSADGEVELRGDVELDQGQVWLKSCGEVSRPSPSTSILEFNGGRTKVRIIEPALPTEPVPIGGSKTAKSVQLFWLQDAIFRVPRSALFLVIRCPAIMHSVKSRAMADLLAAVAVRQLDHEIYLAKMAELDLQVKVLDEGFVISVLGFSQKLLGLLEKALRTFLRFIMLDIDWKQYQADFKLEREGLIRIFKNAEIETDVQANSLRLRALVPGTFSKRQLADELKSMSEPIKLEKKEAYITSESRLDALYHGNVDRNEADRALTCLRMLFEAEKQKIIQQQQQKSSSSNKLMIPRPRVVEMPRGRLNCLVVPSHEPSEKTSAIQLYYQLCDDSPRNQALGECLELLLDEPLFDELRTKQQLGYVVSCGLRRTHGVLGLAVEITSSKFTPTECVRRFEAFLDKFRKEELSSLTDQELRKRLESLSRRILQKDTGIFQETKRHWHCIFEQTMRFNEKWLVVHELLHAPKSGNRFGVTLKEIARFFESTLLAPARRALLVIVVGTGNTEITNLEKEKRALPDQTVLFESVEDFWNRHPGRFVVHRDEHDK